MDLLGSPVEIHLAAGEGVSVRLRTAGGGGREGGRSGGMLTAHRQSRGPLPLRERPAAASTDAASVHRTLFQY